MLYHYIYILWTGKVENIPAAQKALLARAQANSEANLGKYIAGIYYFIFARIILLLYNFINY